MPRDDRRVIIWGLLGVDVLALVVAGVLASRLLPFDILAAGRGASQGLLFAAIPVAIGLFALNHLYTLDDVLEGPLEYGRIVYACTLTAFGLSVLGFWWRDLDQIAPSRRLVTALWCLSIFAVVGGRFGARRIVRALRRRGLLMARTLIVGLGDPGLSLSRHFGELKHAGVEVVGFIDDFLPAGTPVMDGLKVLGPPSALPAILDETGAGEIIIVPTAMAWESFHDLIRDTATLNGHVVRLTTGFRDILAANVKVHHFGSMPLLTMERTRITGLDAVLKQLLDYAAATVLLLIGVPILAVVASLLRIRGIRPFGRMDLIGRGGRRFRAVVLNVSTPGNGIQRVALRLGLDKVAQLGNVFHGRMSIVGPRPVPVDKQHYYERWAPNLLTVKPGITGPWAVAGAHASLDEEMQATLFYIRNYAIWLDLEIIARSVFQVLAGRPAREQKKGPVPRDAVTVHH
jgi:lipopolysaccharide/colanic/teichoic acid biosynthesis glycosyltransferase